MKIEMTSEGPFSFNVSRELVNPVYDDAKKVVNYTMSHTYNQNAPAKRLRDTQIQQLNLDGMAIWYQMNENRPEFWKAWQAMTLVSSTMLES